MTTAQTTVLYGRYRLLGPLDPTGDTDTVLGAAPDNALVLLHRTDPDADDFRLRFRHSAIAGMRIGGPGNAPVLDLDADAERPWLATQFVPSVSLAEVVTRTGGLPAPVVRALASACASALIGVHAAGLVHRNLRPGTVTLTGTGIRLAPPGVLPAGPETPAGPADHLAPEQAMGLETGSATDVFALGSVLVHAASGHAPFTAPSVPYTLFNIAQRDPDLSGVPEELHELVLACLRKNPADRPTPAQILDYAGAVPSPPPWPAEAHSAIAAQHSRADELLARHPAPAAMAEPPAGIGTRIGRTAGAAGAAARSWWSRHGAPARAGVLAAVGLLLVAVVGGGFLVGRGAPESGPFTGPTLAQIRTIDACPWLTSLLGENISIDGETVAPDSWKFEPNGLWSCRATSGKQSIRLELGGFLEYVTARTEVVDGVAVHYGSDESCDRAVLATDEGYLSGIQISLGGALGTHLSCAPADALVAAVVRTLATAPRATDPAASLRFADPCALFDRAALPDRIGPIPAVPSIAGAHTCRFDGRLGVTVSLATENYYARGQIVQRDGVSMYAKETNSDSRCTRIHARNLAGRPAEFLEMAVTGGLSGSGTDLCELTERLLVDAVHRLPAG